MIHYVPQNDAPNAPSNANRSLNPLLPWSKLLCVTASHLSSSGSILLPPGPSKRLYTSSSRVGSLFTAQILFLALFAKSSCSGAFMPSGVWLHRGFVFVLGVVAGTLKVSGVDGADSVAYARTQGEKARAACRQRARLGRQDWRAMVVDSIVVCDAAHGVEGLYRQMLEHFPRSRVWWHFVSYLIVVYRLNDGGRHTKAPRASM